MGQVLLSGLAVTSRSTSTSRIYSSRKAAPGFGALGVTNRVDFRLRKSANRQMKLSNKLWSKSADRGTGSDVYDTRRSLHRSNRGPRGPAFGLCDREAPAGDFYRAGSPEHIPLRTYLR